MRSSLATSWGEICLHLPFIIRSKNLAKCPVTITPAEIVVRYGDPASANCSTSVSDAAGMGWEATFGGVGLTTAPTVHWAVKKLEVWDLQPLCFITLKNNDQCDKTLNITVYKTPDKVSILDNGPMVEGKEYHLKCDISDVVPADKVKVKWYRNDEYVQDMVSDTHVDPHNNNISAILTIIPKKDDNGANFTCVAELHLGENGPQPVPAATSEPYIAVVHLGRPITKDYVPLCPWARHFTHVPYSVAHSGVCMHVNVWRWSEGLFGPRATVATNVVYHHQSVNVRANE
uniref:Ig-like domain-containing protein n=1 Tax=Sphaeramia orbicularis TaxID=375764 RepID=A0A673C7D1_9TELE